MRLNKPEKRGISFLGYIFIFLFLILVLSLISLFYFNSQSSIPRENEVKFWFYHHKDQTIGESGTFFVFIHNKEDYDLKNVEIILNYPDNFILDFNSPEANEPLVQGGVWSFDEIKKNQLKEIEIQGKFFF